LNPIRMYLFTSAIFFLIFFSITDVGDKIINTTYNGKTADQVEKMDSLEFRKFTADIDGGKLMSREQFMRFMDTSGKGGLHFSTDHYKSRNEYDSLLKAGKVHDGWFDKMMNYKEIELKEKYHNNQKQIFRALGNNFLHSFPQMLFISLPLFAFILKLLYFRRKEFYYTSHAIFSVHLYVFIFIMLLIILGLNRAMDYSGWSVFGYLIIPVVLYIFYYQYKSMRNFYMQRRAKTILKYCLLNIAVLFVISLLMVVFIFFSLLKI